MKLYSGKLGKLSDQEIIFSGIYIYVLIPTRGYNNKNYTVYYFLGGACRVDVKF